MDASRVGRRFLLAASVVGCWAVFVAPAGAQAQSGISGSVTKAGQPAEGACVAAYTPTGALPPTPTGLVGFTVVAMNGTYTLNVPDGSYKVVFATPQGPCGTIGAITLATEWYNDRPDYPSADVVVVDGGDLTTGVNAVVSDPPPPPVISGTVRNDSTLQPIGGVCVAVFDDVNGPLPGNPLNGFQAFDLTDSNGEYSVNLSAAGDYKVVFANPASGCGTADIVQEWYQDTAVHSIASVVSVGAGATTVNGFVTENVVGGPNEPPTCPETHPFVAEGETIHLVGNCTDAENDPISYSLVQAPGGGSHTLFPPDAIDYTPAVGTTSATLIYSITDGHHPPVPFTVSIAVVSPGETEFETAEDATASDPFAVGVSLPAGSESWVSLDVREVTDTPPDGFFFLNQEYDISAPNATNADDPLRFVFKLDSSLLTDPDPDLNPNDVEMLRNTAAINASCPPAGSRTNPAWWPCEESRDVQPDGDLWITVLTMEASVWNPVVSDEPDADDDGVADDDDNCPVDPNADQADLDGDGLGDACDDFDDRDSDGDGVKNGADNCVNAANTNQADADHDGIGDLCDSDRDGDGIANVSDNCANVPNPTQLDADHDGVGAACDTQEVPTSKDDCKGNGWKAFNGIYKFKNQGDCVSYVATAGKNKPNGRRKHKPRHR
jgi:hypothetical protein